MLSFLRPVALLTTSVTAGVLLVAPGAARAADTTTQLSAADLTAALRTVSTRSTAAAGDGFRATVRMTDGKQSLSGTYLVDPDAKVVSTRIRIGAQRVETHAVAGKGMYVYVGDPTTRSAAKMMGRPKVRYAFLPKTLSFDALVEQNAPAPAVVLAESLDRPGVRTSHDNGSTDFAVRGDKDAAVTLHVDRAGVLTAARSTSKEGTFRLTYRYGPQRVTLPAASVTADWTTLTRAVAYLTMPAAVKSLAERAAARTRVAADGKKVQVAALRKIVRQDATTVNRSKRVIVRVSDIDAGAQVAATNPWTRRTVSYTVTASGNKVLVSKN